MVDKSDFFSFKNTVNKVSDETVLQNFDYLETVKTFSRITNKSIYIVDYQSKGFDYVSENPLFLCGHTAADVQKMGYDFYLKHVPENDLKLLLTINTIGFDFYEGIGLSERKKHIISYDFHLTQTDGRSILINQKLTPLFLTEDGKIWKALCVVSLSSENSSGNIRVYKEDENKMFSYNLKDTCWVPSEKITLTNREKEIIQYSIKNATIKEIATALFVSPDTIKFHRKKLFEKLEVSNISEAVSYVIRDRIDLTIAGQNSNHQ